ncbi:MAG: malto-oligosyltrehalose trehalohydrolase [Burkholderiales bacterium]|nr:malto-oligosyltrehalose trehalohydrolase [Burkholderiales bacterium]
MRRAHRMPFGAQLDGDKTAFRLWAPGARHVDLVIGDEATADALTMASDGMGWHTRTVDGARAGTRYAYRIDGGLTVPDPASRANPDGVHARSAVVDPGTHAWRDERWRGRPWREAVIYEVHVGTFTPEGSFAGVIARLDDLVDLGVTTVELMPVAAFPGTRNWGYDGVLPFAPAACYGTPEDLKRLVDEAHARGLMMLLDVVYNHFGPEGNYLHAYAPQFFNPRHQTPWGAAINFDGESSATVREFFIHNALYWLDEYHFDGLRVDAVHAIADDSQPDIVTELTTRVHEHFGATRHVHLVLENDHNQARYLERNALQQPILATAQWNDDLHHALHVIATGERDGYYADYAERPVTAFGRALAEGFVYQGDVSVYREGAPRGERSAHLPPVAFVAFAQNHDQIGNRALGERIAEIAEPEVLRALTACLLLAPQVPLLFMGEEFAASTPFLFFCDFGPELAAAVTRGRREEFARFARFRDPGARQAIPDPNDEATMVASTLDWSEVLRPRGARWRAFYRHCLDARRRYIVPWQHGVSCGGSYRVDDEALLRVDWYNAAGRGLHLVANLGPNPVGAVRFPSGQRVYATDGVPDPGVTGALAGYALTFNIDESR